MGQCVSRKAGAVIAASGHHGSPSYRIMEKPPKNQSDNNKGATKRGSSYTRGTAMSFGFRRRPASGIPMPISTTYSSPEPATLLPPRSKSAGPEHDRKRTGVVGIGGGGGGVGVEESNDIDDAYQGNSTRTFQHTSSSGRSTPRLAPPKKESSGIAVRTNRFGFRTPQSRYTNKVGDVCSSHSVSHYNQEKEASAPYPAKHQSRSNTQVFASKPIPKPSAASNNNSNASTTTNNNNNSNVNPIPDAGTGGTRRPGASSIPEPVSKYTLHTSHLPLPQFAVRMNDSNSKIAKTVVNQTRKISTASKGSSASSKDGSGTEDSGVGSQQGCCQETECFEGSRPRSGHNSRPRNLRMVVNGKSFDVRDVDDDSTVTEISVIPLPKTFANGNLSTGLVRERATQYQRIFNKDNRYNDSTTSMSTTSSEGYDEGLGEEKAYKDRAHSEKVPSIKSDFSPPSSDDPEYGHGEAMADEYSLSSNDEYHRNVINPANPLKTVSNAAKTGALPKSTLRSVLLTIEDPAFAAVAATSTTLIDDETSPVDSLFDSPTASITQSDGKASKKECEPMERSGNTIEVDSPGTPTNASNSLSLSEGREFFDDEIADQPGLVFDDTLKGSSLETTQSTPASQAAENSLTLVESSPKTNTGHKRSVENSPMHVRRVSRAGSVDTLSPCESIASDDLMLDYERSDASSYEESNQRMDSNTALHEMDDATILSELEAQGEEVMREWSSLLGTHQTSNSNSANNNINSGAVNSNNNNQVTNESGICSGRTSRLLRSRSGTESPRSIDSVRSRQVSSPLRPPRNIQSPGLDSGDESSIRVERGTYQHMFQDIVSIKTMLLKLKRVLQESGENGLTRAETLNPFDNSIKNGLFYNLNEGNVADASTSPGSGAGNVADELADLRRQVVFMQGQLEDKDRTIQTLQFQMSKLQGPRDLVDSQNGISSGENGSSVLHETCNAATQTEKMRPVSAGPSLLQGLPQESGMGPLVSWSDLWEDHPRPPLLLDCNGIKTYQKSSSSERSPRTTTTTTTTTTPTVSPQRTRQQQHQQNGYLEKPENSNRRLNAKNRDLTIPLKSYDSVGQTTAKTFESVANNSAISKSSIPRKLHATASTTTLIPKAARAVPATGRSPHNA